MRGLDGYALACRRVGQPLVRCGRTWWREVRPCFFRPLLPFLEVPSGPAGLPFRAALGGCQYPSYAGGTAPNSCFVYLAFTDAPEYNLTHLRHGHRWEVRSGERRFVIKPFPDASEFRARAHPVYLEFHERTKYDYLEDRIRRPQFDRWVDAEFADPGLVALGAWAGDSLVAVSMSRVVGAAWLYSTFFASNDGLRGHVAGLMLHHVRSLAAAVDGVSIVFGGSQKLDTAGASVDAFYLHRGATLIRRPTVLRVNPLARWMLSRFRPAVWEGLRGEFDAAGGAVSHGR